MSFVKTQKRKKDEVEITDSNPPKKTKFEIDDSKKITETRTKVQLNKPAPNFTKEAVLDKNFKKISLSDYKGKYVLLFFYPLDFT